MPRSKSPLVAALVLAALASGSCATTVGTLAGPITGPITTWRHTFGMPPWAQPLVLPMAVAIGPFLGLVQGVRCDLGFAQNGAYGEDGHPPFALVFDPSSTAHARQFPK